MSIDISTRMIGRVRVIAVAGRVDHLSAADFESGLAPLIDDYGGGPGQTPAIVFDLGAMSYISSAGLRVLWAAAKRAREREGKMAVAALTALVAEVFTVTRFDIYFGRFDTVDAAVAAMAV